MVVPQVRPRCTHREEAAAAEGGAPREVSEAARGLPGCCRPGPARSCPGPGRAELAVGGQLELGGRRARRWRLLGGPATRPGGELIDGLRAGTGWEASWPSDPGTRGQDGGNFGGVAVWVARCGASTK